MSSLFIWVGAILIETALLCGHFAMSPALDALRWLWILVIAGGIHFFLAHHLVKRRKRLRPVSMIAVFLMAVVFRLTAISLPPSLSDDIYRNVWDGTVQQAKHNPYEFSPDAPELSNLRDETIWPKVNHPELKTIYPPAAQVFSLVAAKVSDRIGDGPESKILGWKLTILIVELIGAAILAFALYRKSKGAAFIIYGWSPLAVVEFYGSGHVDAAGVGMLAGALGLILLHRRVASGMLFAISLLTKLVVLPVALGFLALRGKPARLLGSVVATVILCLPYVGAGKDAVESLRLYQAEWEFNGVVHRILHIDSWAAVPDRIARGAWDELAVEGSVEQKRAGRLIAVGLVLLGGAVAARFSATPASVAAWTLGAFLMIQPTIYPWYVTWLLPLLAIQYVRAFLVWTVTVPFSYEVLIAHRLGEGWVENPYLQAAALFPVLFFALWDLFRKNYGVTIVETSPAAQNEPAAESLAGKSG